MYLSLALFCKCSVALQRNVRDSREEISCQSGYRMSELFTGESARFCFVLFFNFVALQGKYARKTFRFLLHIGLTNYCTYSKKQSLQVYMTVLL